MGIIIAGNKDFKCPHCGGDRLLVPVIMTGQGAMPVMLVVGKAIITQQAQGYAVQVPQGQPCHICGDCGKTVLQLDIEALAKEENTEKGGNNVGEGPVAL